jgi:SAM-dependent methyltransferase
MNNQWDERYSASEYMYGTEPNDFLREEYHRIRPGGKVLCLADGEGRNGVFLAQQGFDVTSVDASQVGLEKALALAKANDVMISTVHADLADYDLGVDQWDAVVSIFCHLPPDLRSRVHNAATSSLRMDGVVILEAYTVDQLSFKTGGPPVAALMMSAQQLRHDFEALDVIVCGERTRMIHEGALHNGQSAVVQFVAQRNR